MLDLSIRKHQVLLASALGASAYCVLSLFLKDNKRVYKKIPSPGSWIPYFGHLFSLGKLPGLTVTKWNEELGPIIQLQMGQQTWIMLADPYLAHEIFATNGLVASERPTFTFSNYYSHGGLGVSFSNPTKRWKKVRGALLDVLSPPRVDEYSDILKYEADCLVEQLLARTKRDGQINPITTLNAGALNVVFKIVFGQRVESADDPLFKDIMDFVNPSVEYLGMEGPISQFIPVFGLLDSLLGKKRFFKNYIATVRDPLFKRLIQQAVESDKKCLMKNFIEYDIEEKDLIVMMSDLVAAGTDTVSLTLSWLLIIITHHPEIQQKLHAEIDAFINSHHRLPTFKERDQLPYLISVQRECLRYRSTTNFGLPHLTKEDIIVRDYIIPKGALLYANMTGIHMNPDVYPDPDIFKPERFMDETRTIMATANGKVGGRDVFGFGFGRRICPGIYMAEVELFYTCTRIFAHCVVASPLDANGDEVPIDLYAGQQGGLVYMPAPHQVRFLPRPDSSLESPLTNI
ncbi:cytochrome P450 [Chlamydoabsidia padenii]|nr:cytochrome P450 [Chlamydoabsidia padenii]